MFPDKYDWRGCESVRYDPERLGGRATVLNTRMDADGVFENYLDGMCAEEISDAYGSDLAAVKKIIDFALVQKLTPREQAVSGFALRDEKRFDFVISPRPAGKALFIRYEEAGSATLTGAGIWETYEKAKEVAQTSVMKLLHPDSVIFWHDS